MHTAHSDTHVTTVPARRPNRLKIPLRSLQLLAVVIDTAGIVLASWIAELLCAFNSGVDPDAGRAIGVAAAASVLFVSFMLHSGMYSMEALTSRRRQVVRVLLFWTSALLFLGAIAFALKIVPHFPRDFASLLYTTGAILIVTGRVVFVRYITRAVASAKIAGPKIALIDCCEARSDLAAPELDRHGFEIAMSFKVPREASEEDLSTIAARALLAVRGSPVEQIFITADCNTLRFVRPMLRKLQAAPLPVRIVLNERTTELFTWKPERIGTLSSFEVHRPPLTLGERAVKRVMDIVIALAALVALAPVMLLIALIVRIDSQGPVFFRQNRKGFNGRCFRIFKFRTMSVLEDGDNVRQASRNDPRVTRSGRMLRKSSLDELPQLLNVLAGDMSIIGPRPHAISHDDYYSSALANYAFRHKLKPEITGWAQAHGYRGETLTVEAMEQRIHHDIWYIDHWSLRLDFEILLRTVVEIFRGPNAY